MNILRWVNFAEAWRIVKTFTRISSRPAGISSRPAGISSRLAGISSRPADDQLCDRSACRFKMTSILVALFPRAVAETGRHADGPPQKEHDLTVRGSRVHRTWAGSSCHRALRRHVLQQADHGQRDVIKLRHLHLPRHQHAGTQLSLCSADGSATWWVRFAVIYWESWVRFLSNLSRN